MMNQQSGIFNGKGALFQGIQQSDTGEYATLRHYLELRKGSEPHRSNIGAIYEKSSRHVVMLACVLSATGCIAHSGS